MEECEHKNNTRILINDNWHCDDCNAGLALFDILEVRSLRAKVESLEAKNKELMKICFDLYEGADEVFMSFPDCRDILARFKNVTGKEIGED